MHGCIFGTLFCLSLLSGAASAAAPIPNFHEVEAGVYRGGALSESGIAELKKLGIKTILNLNDRAKENAQEAAAAKVAGISEIALPMSGFWWPKTAVVTRAVDVMEDRSLRPLYVHCEHGQDRTGLVVGLYRVESEHWQPAHAYREMKQLGFHPLLVFLNRYFEERTGWDD